MKKLISIILLMFVISVQAAEPKNGYLIFTTKELAQAFCDSMKTRLGLPRVIPPSTKVKTIYAAPYQIFDDNDNPTGTYAVRIIKSVWPVLTEIEKNGVVDTP